MTRSTNPIVSIALPVYNGEDHLRESLESFQRQNYPHFELTICDNASTDSTPEIAAEFCKKDERFIYQRQENFLNAKDNFTRAYQLTSSQHPYFLWACDDNLWHEQFLARTVEYMEAHPSCSVCGYHLYEFEGDLTRRIRRPRIPVTFTYSRIAHILFERLSAVSIYGLMRRRVVDSIRIDLPNIDDYPDRYILLQLRAHGYFHVVPEVLLGFRGGGISTTKDDPWVKKVVDLKFGESEYALLQSFEEFSRVERSLIANKFAYQSLRHNIPGTVSRLALAPAYVAAWLMNWLRPSAWRVGSSGLEKTPGCK